jgi:sulfatase maturation enzyme AslB (radical SAM superfamily)
MNENSAYCPMIHGGLTIDLKHGSDVNINHCCLYGSPNIRIKTNNVWAKSNFDKIRQKNNNNEWSDHCWACQSNERAGLISFRQGTLKQFGIQRNLSGPLHLDLYFNSSCNLACRSCGPHSSTFWQKHLIDNGVKSPKDPRPNQVQKMISILKTLDLSNLRHLHFAGGEPLLGESYWQVAEYIASNVPDANKQLMLSFQTNGTQPIKEKHYSIIEKFHLVKLNVSLDGVGDRFEYLRWPASWNQVTKNIKTIVETAPVNVMFNIEETISIFNFYYHHELVNWAKENFSTNRLGDIINHTTHNASGMYSLKSLTNEYIENMKSNNIKDLVPVNFTENAYLIRTMISEINKVDGWRNQDCTKIFPEVASFYSRYI